MFAHAVNFNILYNDHLTHVFMKFGRIQNRLGIHGVSLGQVLHGLGHTVPVFLTILPGLNLLQSDRLHFYNSTSGLRNILLS